MPKDKLTSYSKPDVTASRDARRSNYSDKGEAVRQQGITKHH